MLEIGQNVLDFKMHVQQRASGAKLMFYECAVSQTAASWYSSTPHVQWAFITFDSRTASAHARRARNLRKSEHNQRRLHRMQQSKLFEPCCSRLLGDKAWWVLPQSRLCLHVVFLLASRPASACVFGGTLTLACATTWTALTSAPCRRRPLPSLP